MRRSSIALAFVVVGCGAKPEHREPVVTGRRPAGLQVLIENRTGQTIDLDVLEIDNLTVDRRLVDGELALPIGDVPSAREIKKTLAPLATFELETAPVHLRDYSANASQEQRGGILRADGGPRVLAIGSGRVLVRRIDGGPPSFEAEDPRTVTLLPVDRDVLSCADGASGERIEGLPPSWTWLQEQVDVTRVTRNGDGCFSFMFEDPAKRLNVVRACLPDEAFPFELTEPLLVGPPTLIGPRTGFRFDNGKGEVLQLLQVDLYSRSPLDMGLISVASDIDATCATIDRECGDVRAPARLVVSVEGTVVRAPAFRSVIPFPSNPRHGVYVLGASSRPVAIESCPARPYGETTSPAEVFLAVVEK